MSALTVDGVQILHKPEYTFKCTSAAIQLQRGSSSMFKSVLRRLPYSFVSNDFHWPGLCTYLAVTGVHIIHVWNVYTQPDLVWDGNDAHCLQRAMFQPSPAVLKVRSQKCQSSLCRLLQSYRSIVTHTRPTFRGHRSRCNHHTIVIHPLPDYVFTVHIRDTTVSCSLEE